MWSGASVCLLPESPFHKCSCVFLLGWPPDWHLSPDPSMFSRRPACPLCQPVIFPKPSLPHSTTSPHLSRTHIPTHTKKETSLHLVLKYMRGIKLISILSPALKQTEPPNSAYRNAQMRAGGHLWDKYNVTLQIYTVPTTPRRRLLAICSKKVLFDVGYRRREAVLYSQFRGVKRCC